MQQGAQTKGRGNNFRALMAYRCIGFKRIDLPALARNLQRALIIPQAVSSRFRF